MLPGTQTDMGVAQQCSPRAILDGMRWTGRLPATLIPAAALPRLAHAAALMPDGVSGWGFECRLGEGDDRVDFGALIAAGAGPGALLASAAAPVPTVLRAPAAEPVVDFCRAWSDRGSLLHRSVPFIFLELDCDGPVESRAPSVFVRLPTPWEAPPDAPLSEHLVLQVARTSLSILRRGRAATAVEAALDHAFATLPAGGRILHVGLLLGRRDETRVYASIPRASAAAYLRGVGLGACADGVMEIVNRYDAAKPIAEIQFDLLPGAVPRVGVEIPCQHRVAAERIRRFGAVLDGLVRDDLSAAAKRDALLAWPGLELLEPRRPGWRGMLIREISHLKVVYQPGAPWRAKAYVSVTPRWWPIDAQARARPASHEAMKEPTRSAAPSALS